MRLDKFLKVTRIIKRRTVAKELADNGNIVVNGDPKKSSYDVKKGDIFEIKYFNKNIKVKVLDLPPESLKKEFIETKNILTNILSDLKDDGATEKELYERAIRTVEAHMQTIENELVAKIKELIN